MEHFYERPTKYWSEVSSRDAKGVFIPKLYNAKILGSKIRHSQRDQYL